jgi:hypothetical protein
MTRTRILGATLAAGVALVAAGCGGDDQDVSASTQWAGDLCTAVNTWRSSISSTMSTLTQNPSRDGFEQAANDAKDSTETLIDTVRDLGSPGTESGDEAQSAVESLANDLQSDVDTIQDAVSEVSGVQGLLDAVSTVSATVAKISSQLSSTASDLSALRDVDDELRQSFEDAESCDGVVPGS